MQENLPSSDFPSVSKEQYDALTDLAFKLERGSHYEDPRGMVMFAGAFPESLLSTFEAIAHSKVKNKKLKLPKNVAKMSMFASSRQVQYAIGHTLGWESKVRLPGEPAGRSRAGSTIIWELWKVGDEYMVDTYLFQPGSTEELVELDKGVTLKEMQARYKQVMKKVGSWEQVCSVEDPILEHHSSSFWFTVCVVLAFSLYFMYQRGTRYGGYQRL